MKRNWVFGAAVIFVFGFIFYHPSMPAFAKENLADLKKQIEDLRAEVAGLKAASAKPQANRPGDNPANAGGFGMDPSWDPFSEMQQMQDRMNRIFRDSFMRSGSVMAGPSSGLAAFYEPDLDIQDKKDHYLMILDLPGLDKDKIDIKAAENDIVISGERNYQSEAKDDKEGFYRMERRFGSFSRRLPLPVDASSEGISAKYEKGVLEIKIPKKEPAKPKEESRKIKIG